MGFTGDCRDGGVPGSPSHAGNAMTVPGVRASWAWAPDPSLCGANALLRLNPRILSTHEIGWWSIFSAVYFDIEFVIQGLNTVNSCLTAGCYCLPGWLLATGAGLSREGCTARKGGPGTSIRCFCQEDQGRCSYKILEASKLVVVEAERLRLSASLLNRELDFFLMYADFYCQHSAFSVAWPSQN